jgi:hypothetical protein
MSETPTPDNDTGAISYKATMVNGDEATVTVSGFKHGATAIRALIHTGSPEVIESLMQELAEQGDLSIVTLALELGAEAEKPDRR